MAVADPNGSVELIPWSGTGDQQVRAALQMLAMTSEPERSQLVLAAMERFARLTLDADGRSVLPTVLLAHLDALVEPVIRIVVRDNRLWLWRETEWRRGQAQRSEALLKAISVISAA
ncbi:MAG: hypothetical protein ACXU8X_09865 [Caulobacteraceae bacterium]